MTCKSPFDRMSHRMHAHSCASPSCKMKHRSIFFKLIFILLVMALLVHIVVGGFFKLFSPGEEGNPFEKNLEHYASLIAMQIGSPPDTVLALSLAQSYKFDLVYEGNGMRWSNSDKMPDITLPSIENWKKIIGGPAKYWRYGFLIHNEDGSRILIRWYLKPVVDMPREFLFILLFLLTLIFLITHAVIRKALIPVRWLQKGVDKISEGDLDVKVPVMKNDELGRLSEAFNNMVKQIREMIASRDQLLLDVSHELRSPITRMRLALEFLPDSNKKDDIISDLNALETMITEILESERLKQGKSRLKLEICDLVQLIRDAANDFKDTSPGLKMGLPDSSILTIDSERIKMVIRNCLDNAFKYSKPESKPVHLILYQDDPYTYISIHDDGIGVPEDVLPHLFEPFYRVDRSRSKETGGYGLGLHMCQKIMEAHEGCITLQNHPDGGIEVLLQFRNDLG